VSVTLLDPDGNLPTNDPPSAVPQSVPVLQATTRSITLGGIDPEGYPLGFTVTSPPTNGTLSGSAPDLLYTPTGPYTGPDSFTFEVTDSHGQVDSATVDITVHAVPAFEVSVYEPFNYSTGGIDNLNGAIGFAGPWDATRNNPAVDTDSKTWGSLETAGNHVRGAAWSAMIRPIGATLSDAGLMDNGATLWFSVVMDLAGQNTSNADFNLALGTDQFVSSTFGDRENLLGNNAEGIGVTHSGARVQGVYWQDNGDADGVSERSEGDSSLQLNSTSNSRALVVGKIEWGANDSADEILTLYAPNTDMVPGEPILDSWSIPALDQSQFDLVSVQFKDQAQCDEIRFAASYAGVVFGTAASVPTDYDNWSADWTGADLDDPAADWDGDGLTNDEERRWGLSPMRTSSVNPVTLGPVAGSFTYTRRDASLTALNYIVRTSTDLLHWTVDYGAVQTPGPIDADGVETVAVTLSPHLLDAPELFVQVGVAK
jgi:hypothetical protein